MKHSKNGIDQNSMRKETRTFQKLFSTIFTLIFFFSTSAVFALDTNGRETEEQTNNFFIDKSLKDAAVLEAGLFENDKTFHLFSHGKSGELLLNGKWLNAQQLVQWFTTNELLENATHLNIYGCEFAKGEKGKTAVDYLEKELGLLIAASTNVTGKDGDWLLEVGQKNSQDQSFETYQYSLQEICDNGIDDDGDGYVDGFDTDCGAMTFGCFIPGPIASFDAQLVDINTANTSRVSTPIIGDIDNDGIAEILTISFGNILVYQGEDLSIAPITIPINIAGGFAFTAEPAIADIDGDGFGEIIHNGGDGFIRVFSNTGVLLMTSNLTGGDGTAASPTAVHSTPFIADINEDGITEVVVGNAVFTFNSTFTALNRVVAFDQTIAWGRMGNAGNERWGASISVIDILPSPGKEIVAGSNIYTIDFTAGTRTIAQSLNAASGGTIPTSIGLLGGTSVADMDLDGDLDVVTLSRGGRLVVWDPNNNTILYDVTLTGQRGTHPTIANIYNDVVNNGTALNFPEILFLNGTTVRCFNIQLGNSPIWSLATSDLSGATTLTAFDFNGDGRAEILYRDQTTFRIFNGDVTTGAPATLYSAPAGSNTASEGPVVADIDNDGEVEIAVTADNRLHIYGSLGTPWVGGANYWNQKFYRYTNINSDLTVPIEEQPIASVFPLGSGFFPFNISNVQPSLQNGTVGVPDAIVSAATAVAVGVNCDEYMIEFTITNQGDGSLATNNPFQVYDSNPRTNVSANLLASGVVGQAIPVGGSATESVTVTTNAPSVFIVVNTNASMTLTLDDADFAASAIECDFSNNFFEVTSLPCLCFDGAIVGTPTANDPDADGINNACDLDDDNDGILDSDETICTTTPNNTIAVSSGGGVSNAEFSLIDDGDISADTGIRMNSVGEYVILDLGSSFPSGTQITVWLWKNNDTDKTIRIVELANSNVDLGGGTNPLIINQGDIINVGSSDPFMYTLTASAQFLQIEMTLRVSGRIEIVEADILDCFTDTDNDGIPNRLDQDSDNDGCNDVHEAGYTDAGFDGVLGDVPTVVNDDGLVIGTNVVDGYTGTTPAVTDSVAIGGTICAVILPVELVNFQAVAQDNRRVALTWQTVSEKENDYFDIYKSTDLESWEYVTSVNGAGNSSELQDYSANDLTPFSGASYYKLTQVDFNGTVNFGGIRSVEIDTKSNEGLSIYPNPTTGKLKISGAKDQLQDLQLFNSVGQQINMHILVEGNSSVTIDISNLESGVYLIRSEDKTYRIIKN